MSALHEFITAPARYEPETPWGPFEALAATVAIVLTPMLLLALVMLTQSAFGSMTGGGDAFMKDMMRLSTPIGVLVFGISQLVSLGLVWWFAGRQGMRLPTLSLTSPYPSYTMCFLFAALFILVMGVIELGLYRLIKFDVFKDSKFLVEGLRSAMWPFTVFMAVVLAPLWEELTFRGFLLSALARTRLGIVGGGLISTALWTLLHASYSIPALISVFAAGLVMTWLVWKTGSLRIAIVTHAMVNASAAVFAGLYSPY